MTRPIESDEFFATVLKFIEKGDPFAVVTVLRADGSTPVPAGAKAIIKANGAIHGTVGGGAVEAEAQRIAKDVVRSGKPVVFEFDLHGCTPQQAQPICGGSMRLLVDPSADADKAECQQAAAALARRERGLWLTLLRRCDGVEVNSRYLPSSALSRRDGFPDGDVLVTCLADESPGLFPSPVEEAVEVFIEPVIPKPILAIVGGGHVGQAVAAQASLVSFEIRVIEDRPEFADSRLFPPGTTTRCGNVAEEVAALPIGPDTFIVIVTRGHQQDAVALRACIRRPAAYIGMIGSRRKVPLVRRQFLESGWATAEEFDRVHAPIGLDIGAVTVPEIATSIVAQLIAFRRKGASPRIPLS